MSETTSWELTAAPESTDHVKIDSEYGLFIGGEFVESNSKEKFASVNPATEKSLTDLADQIDDAERADINAKLEDLRSVMEGDDKEAIETKLAALTEVTSKLAERAYSQQAEGAEDAAAGDSDAGPAGGADDAVDAEFEEVKDDKAS